ncbi:hypothetical protein [Paraburkholderia youngii]|uniref:hypothetical protein n=1 Tax=Paraburkholderia youngii TaxID=2782701 RepID=UPI003D1DE18D
MKAPRMNRPAFVLAIFVMLETACLKGTPAADVRSAGPAVADGRLSFTVQSPSGEASRLTYLRGDGRWLEDHAASNTPDEVRMTPASAERQQEASAPVHPESIFIDGPTGFTYVWTAGLGWKFVGRVVDPPH